MTEIAHPRDVYDFHNGEATEADFADALARGRLHHAWMLVGPEGVGKATFAYRAARRLLGARPDASRGVLGAAPEDVVSRQIAARSHPDLMVLERVGEDGKLRKVIPVDDARKLPEFFSKAPASSPYRVAIIDSVDDMNPNAANALLKTLEEPPERGVILLISHAPGGLLPTIRSRCRRLRFHAWSEADAARFLIDQTGASDEDALRLAAMARGAPGRALELAGRDAVAIDRLAREILHRLPEVDPAGMVSVTDSFRGAEGALRFELLFERLAEQVHGRAIASAEQGATPSDRWFSVWDRLVRLPQQVEAVNLDRTDAFWAAMADLRAAARGAAA
jgi:DNA polymerase-3 subunit delta'